MLIRVRSNVGVWRVGPLDERTATVSDVIDSIATTRPHVLYEQPLSLDASCTRHLDTTQTLSEQGLVHGSMVHCRVDPSTTAEAKPPPSTAEGSTGGGNGTDSTVTTAAAAATNENTRPAGGGTTNMRRIIDKDGTIRLVPTNETTETGNKGFRKGMLPLRDMKMSWTLNDFIALDSQFEFKIQRQEKAICAQVSVDVPSITDFQAYLQSFQFQRKRLGFLYGRYEDVPTESDSETPAGRRTIVEAIYEPPQQVDHDNLQGFDVLDDPREELVQQIAQLCGLERVGWIFGHEPRQPGFVFTSAELILAAELQLEAAGGVDQTTPFVTVKVTQGLDGNVSVEAFQVSQQCMAMVAEEALQVGDNPNECVVHETFTAIQEGKASKTVENDFFLTVVPIVQHTSPVFVADFPRANRDLDTRTPSHDEMRRQLQRAGQQGWTFEQRLADFNLLIYLAQFLDLQADMPKICAAAIARDNAAMPLDDGYKILIKSMAGMDSSY